MLISITTSGGIGGFGLPGKAKAIETNKLSEPVREKVCRAFSPDALEKLENGRSHPGSADRLTYHVTVTDSGGESYRFNIPEAALPDSMIDIIDNM